MKTPLYLPVCALVLYGCATGSTAPDQATSTKIGAAVTAPLADLNLIRTKIPEILIKATEFPYQRPDDAGCACIETEITALDAALGPDLDAHDLSPEQSLIEKGGTMAEDSAIGALRGTTTGFIPFRSWVRKLTGAERHSKEVASAIAAGIVRRAYLKGLGESLGCAPPASPLPPEPDAGQEHAGSDAAAP